MRPILRTCTGLTVCLGLLVALASCGGIEVISGSITMNSGYTFCRYTITPRLVGPHNVEVWPVWNNTTDTTQRQYQDVKTICMLLECGNSQPGKKDCRDPGPDPIDVQTNFTNEPYVVVRQPCDRTCTGYRGSW